MKRFPHLENIQIAKPCPANWDEMTGDDASKFCKICAKNVYALEEMNSEEAEKLISQKGVCMRIRQDSLGRIFTKSGAILLAAGALTMAGCKTEEEHTVGTIPQAQEHPTTVAQALTGKVSNSIPEKTETPESTMLTGEVAPKSEPKYTMGDAVALPPIRNKK